MASRRSPSSARISTPSSSHFITTHIINFLKGLPLSSSTDLADLLNDPPVNKRSQIGFELLRLLIETGRLYFWTKRGLVENRKFKTELFARVLAEAGQVTCQNGNRVVVGNFARQLRPPPVRSYQAGTT